jgi:SAM-dependent methyltransferase
VARDERDWRLDEEARAGQEHLDRAYVAAYDTKSPTDWSDEVATLLSLGVGAKSTVVDLGAGTGTFALAIAPHVMRVVGVDVSDAMVDKMRSRGIEAAHAGFLTYEHEGAPPDAVFTRNALHHLPDFWKAVALERIAHMLRPAGVLLLEDLVYSFEPVEADQAIASWLESAPDDPTVGWTADQLAEHVRTEHSTFTWLLEPMLERTGFEIRERWVSASQAYASYACVLLDRDTRQPASSRRRIHSGGARTGSMTS